MCRRLSAFLLAALASLPLYGQSSTASILGVVQDSTGAVVPAAAVTATHQATNQVFRTATGTEGYYEIPALPVGEYRVEVEVPGFQRVVKADVLVQADDRIRLDFTLEPGTVNESVTVSADAQLVETSRATLGQVVDSHRMIELPLNGRNMLELQLLSPGALSATHSGGGVQSPNHGFSINGGRGGTVNYLMDGADNNDAYQNTASLYPNPDAVQEFSILSNAFSAEYGRASGAVVNVITRSGTNEFHGSAFEFLRNDALNTRNFFSLGEKPKLRQNQFGGAFGGPIRKDRTFFFLSYQATRIRSAPTASSVFVPTEAERRGDYSQSSRKPRDPLTGKPFPGALIPASRFDPVAAAFLERYVPLPNLPNGQFSSNNEQDTNADQGLLRIDHSFSASHNMFVRSFHDAQRTVLTETLPVFRNRQEFRAWNLSLGDNLILRPTLVNTFTIGMNRTSSHPGPGNRFRWRDLGAAIPLAVPEDDPTNSRLRVANAFGFTQRVNLELPRTVVYLRDSMSYVHGKHMLKWGFEARHLQEIRRTNFVVDGSFVFTGQFSRVPVADFQLGLPARFQQLANIAEGLARNLNVSWYLQDDWKLTPRLTLNLGLRYEPFFPMVDQRDRRSTFRAGQQSTVFPTAPTGLVFVGDEGIHRGIVPNQWNRFAPRAGLAWDITGKGKTSLRVGYGIYYDAAPTLQNNLANQPFTLQYNIIAPPSLSDPYGSTVPEIPYYPPETPEERARARFFPPIRVAGFDAGFRNPYAQQYNVSFEHQIEKYTKVTIAYVGSKGTHLFVPLERNAAVYGPGATLRNTNARRPYKGFQSIVHFTSASTSSYNALQVSVNRRFAQGFTLLANYTWAKSIDTRSDNLLNPNVTGPQNPYDLRSERAVSDFDITHAFVNSFVWEIPWLGGAPGWRGFLLGGWQLSGIAILRTGRPVHILTGRDNSLTGVGKDRPDLVGDWRLPEDRPRAEKIQEYFNRSAFAPNRPGTFGNLGRNPIRGPGYVNFDFSLVKSFPVGERVHLQFRAEVFNAFNNVNLGLPVGNLSAPNFAQITTAGDSRIFQLAMKLRW